MIQLSIMAMVLGAVVLKVLPLPRRREAALATECAGMGVFGAGMVGLAWSLALPYV